MFAAVSNHAPMTDTAKRRPPADLIGAGYKKVASILGDH
jgi:hypothetical protein